VIRTNDELQLMLQLKYDNIILLSTKLVLSRLSHRHTLKKSEHMDYTNVYVSIFNDPKQKITEF
jgi:hypothetical protein